MAENFNLKTFHFLFLFSYPGAARVAVVLRRDKKILFNYILFCVLSTFMADGEGGGSAQTPHLGISTILPLLLARKTTPHSFTRKHYIPSSPPHDV
jgi:hypothetical protein